jgi:hypothetical protein
LKGSIIKIKSMKKIVLIIFLSMITSLLWAQGHFDYIYFNTPDSTVKIDTSISGNIWQIGKPDKPIFDSAFDPPNAMVTDTILYYAPNNFSAFTIKVYDPSWGLYSGDEYFVNFWHKFDTDSLKDGGYIEISYDNGSTWTNIVNAGGWDPYFYYQYGFPNPTIANGNAAFTGRSNGWQHATLVGCDEFDGPNSIYFRFVFSSDSIQTNKEGWMIGHMFLSLGCSMCLGIHEPGKDALISMFPNPATDNLTIETPTHSTIQILNIQGQLIKSLAASGAKTNVDHVGWSSWVGNVWSIPAGVYIVQVRTDKGVAVGKFVKE